MITNKDVEKELCSVERLSLAVRLVSDKTKLQLDQIVAVMLDDVNTIKILPPEHMKKCLSEVKHHLNQMIAMLNSVQIMFKSYVESNKLELSLWFDQFASEKSNVSNLLSNLQKSALQEIFGGDSQSTSNSRFSKNNCMDVQGKREVVRYPQTHKHSDTTSYSNVASPKLDASSDCACRTRLFNQNSSSILLPSAPVQCHPPGFASSIENIKQPLVAPYDPTFNINSLNPAHCHGVLKNGSQEMASKTYGSIPDDEMFLKKWRDNQISNPVINSLLQRHSHNQIQKCDAVQLQDCSSEIKFDKLKELPSENPCEEISLDLSKDANSYSSLNVKEDFVHGEEATEEGLYYLTFFKSPNLAWIQKSDSMLSNIEFSLSEKTVLEHNSHLELYCGRKVAVRYESNEILHRAIVTKCLQDCTLEVYLFDYGCCIIIGRSNLYPLPQKFADISPLALPCFVTHIDDVVVESVGNEKMDTLQKHFQNNLYDSIPMRAILKKLPQVFEGQVAGLMHPRYAVKLYNGEKAFILDKSEGEPVLVTSNAIKLNNLENMHPNKSEGGPVTVTSDTVESCNLKTAIHMTKTEGGTVVVASDAVKFLNSEEAIHMNTSKVKSSVVTSDETSLYNSEKVVYQNKCEGGPAVLTSDKVNSSVYSSSSVEKTPLKSKWDSVEKTSLKSKWDSVEKSPVKSKWDSVEKTQVKSKWDSRDEILHSSDRSHLEKSTILYSLPKVQLPTAEEQYPVILTHVKSIQQFYIHCVNNETAAIDRFHEALNANYRSDKEILNLKELPVGSYWAVCHSDGNWYRGQVTVNNLLSNKGTKETCKLKVFYVDYGDEGIVDISDIRYLQERFILMPTLAVSCSLLKMCPPDCCREYSDYEEVKEQFVKNCGGYKAVLFANFLFCDRQGVQQVVLTNEFGEVINKIIWNCNATVGSIGSEESGLVQSKALVCKEKFGLESVTKDLLSLGVGSLLDVIVTVIASPSQFFVYFPSGIKDLRETHKKIIQNGDLHMLRQSMKQHYQYSMPQKIEQSLSVSDLKVVCEANDGEFEYSRVRILEIKKEQGLKYIKVFFIDYGETQWVAEEQIRTLDECFLSIPPQAAECWLDGFQDPKSSWNMLIMLQLQKLTAGRTLMAEVTAIDSTQERLGVILHDSKRGPSINSILKKLSDL